ncbi:RNase H domain-containing protein [Caerostris darwini]|uniref:RNase H domain-containing protein n=1 Tax=Caerostris darwini TaxID=1538125 RepID=A0AAV4MIW6_9ARAC|nr:RNase H domain-containing protein [Caerostris darwini]
MRKKFLFLLQLFIFSVMRGPFVEEFYQCVTYAFYTALWQEQLYTTLTLIFMFLLPLLILITTYIATFLTIASEYTILSQFSFQHSSILSPL